MARPACPGLLTSEVASVTQAMDEKRIRMNTLSVKSRRGLPLSLDRYRKSSQGPIVLPRPQTPGAPSLARPCFLRQGWETTTANPERCGRPGIYPRQKTQRINPDELLPSHSRLPENSTVSRAARGIQLPAPGTAIQAPAKEEVD